MARPPVSANALPSTLPRTTYSRKPHPTHTPKRRRLDDDPTPADSDSSEPSLRLSPAPPEALAAPDTPASSPPPPPSPLPRPKKSQFNFFTRASAAASSSSSNRRRPIRAPPPRTQNPAPKPKLTQMTIDLGQALQTTCRACGMSYHPSTPDDDALHKRFHAKSVGGVDFALKPPKSHVVWRGSGECKGGGEGDSHVLVVGRSATSAEKRKAKEVLEVVDSELGAAEIGEADLWADGDDGGDRFKVYLYIRGRKCIGLCLAERITKAYRVLDDRLPRVGRGCSSSVSVSDTPQPALLGISRIWTCSSHRRQGIAARLLDCARDTFIYGMHLEKSMVAFSQPTESGGGLARNWFCANPPVETKEGWAVYVEEV